jgi:hypothetical protein
MNLDPTDADLKVITEIAAMPLAVDRVAALRAHVARSAGALSRALSDFIENTHVPEANCSCHISPPCDDCVQNGGIRELIAGAKAALHSPGLPGDEINAALKLCHRLRNGAARMTKDQFRDCLARAFGVRDNAYADNVRVHFQDNPAAFLAHRTPQTQSIELLRVLLEITQQPGDDGSKP